MKTNRPRAVLATALATVLLSPLASAQSDNAANAAAQAQQIPRAPSPPAVSPRLPVNVDDPATVGSDPQQLEEPMASGRPPQSQAGAKAADPSAVAHADKWAQLDADGDGRISATEASAQSDVGSRFAMIDRDGDGFLSADEYRAHTTAMQRDDVPPPPPAHSQGATHAAAHSSVAQRDAWSRLDTDGDGRISSVEASLDQDFSAHLVAMDGDRDGFVTDAEYREFARTGPMSGDANIDEDDADDQAIDEAIDESDAADARDDE